MYLYLMKVIPGMCRAKLDIYVFIDFPVFIPWTHQMKVIPETNRSHQVRYLRLYVDIFIIFLKINFVSPIQQLDL